MSGKHGLEPADSTTISDTKRQKRLTQQGGITMNSGETKDGYGHGIYEIQSQEISDQLKLAIDAERVRVLLVI